MTPCGFASPHEIQPLKRSQGVFGGRLPPANAQRWM